MLGISDLRVLLEELFEVRFKWYNVGLGLGLPVDVLNEPKKIHHCLKKIYK